MPATARIIPINRKRVEYPESEGTVRVFRLWNAREKCQLQWRYYSDPKRAHIGALIEAR
jgi:hypothetical protein